MTKAGGDPDQCSDDGHTALLLAAETGHAAVIETLLSRWKANPKLRTKNGDTALHISARNKHEGSLRLLLKMAPELVQILDGNGLTALHLAVLKNSTFCIDILVQGRADVNLKTPARPIPFLFAMWKHSGDAVKALIRHGANFEITDCYLDYFTHPALQAKERRTKTTSQGQRLAVLCYNISEMVQNIRHSNPPLSSHFGYTSSILGRCLLRGGADADAVLAFQLTTPLMVSAMATSDNTTSHETVYGPACDACSRKVKDVTYVCRSCPNYDLCEKCMPKYDEGAVELQGCVGHSFLRVAGCAWRGKSESKQERVDPNIDHPNLRHRQWLAPDGETLDEWLERLSNYKQRDILAHPISLGNRPYGASSKPESRKTTKLARGILEINLVHDDHAGVSPIHAYS